MPIGDSIPRSHTDEKVSESGGRQPPAERLYHGVVIRER